MSMETNPTGKLLNVRDAAVRMNVSVMTVRRILNSGGISSYRVGRNIRFSEEDIDSYLQRQHVKGWNLPTK
jgi:excisionase family DNA binding protein